MFALSKIIYDAINAENIPISGVAYSPLRIDFLDEATDDQKTQAETIAQTCIDNIATYQADYESNQAKIITPDKLTALVALLVSKNILTQDEVNGL